MKARAPHVRHCLPPPVAAFHRVLVSVFQATRPNGITTTWSCETNRDLITQVQNGAVSTYGYANDAIGRRTSMSRSGSAYANPDIISYTYNDRSELTGAQANVDSTYSYSYAYDPIGNRTTVSEAGVPWTYAANSLNQYTSATENNTQLSFSYDLDGSMTHRPVSATDGWTQLWNGENRMVETFKGNNRLTFRYDYMGRRVEKCVYSGNVLTSKTYYVYDGFKCVEELDALDNDTVVMRHAWQPFDIGLDVILATTDGNGTSYFLHDANKNVMQKTSAVGNLLEHYAYAPFGKTMGENMANIGFSSEKKDMESMLEYFIYRYYASPWGKWLSREPLFEQKSESELEVSYLEVFPFEDYKFTITVPPKDIYRVFNDDDSIYSPLFQFDIKAFILLEEDNTYAYAANSPSNFYDVNGNFTMTGFCVVALSAGWATGKFIDGISEMAYRYVLCEEQAKVYNDEFNKLCLDEKSRNPGFSLIKCLAGFTSVTVQTIPNTSFTGAATDPASSH